MKLLSPNSANSWREKGILGLHLAVMLGIGLTGSFIAASAASLFADLIHILVSSSFCFAILSSISRLAKSPKARHWKESIEENGLFAKKFRRHRNLS